MDFIIELPLAGSYDAVLVTMDCFMKMAHFLLTTSNVTMEQTGQFYCQHVWKLHGVPEDIVSDRGPQFISHFMQCLLQKLEIQGNRLMAHHPQSDGRTEQVNQTLEQYPWIYCDYQQDYWHQLLPLAKFV